MLSLLVQCCAPTYTELHSGLLVRDILSVKVAKRPTAAEKEALQDWMVGYLMGDLIAFAFFAHGFPLSIARIHNLRVVEFPIQSNVHNL